MMALEKSLLEDSTSECNGEVKVPKSKPYAGERNVQKVDEFINNME